MTVLLAFIIVGALAIILAFRPDRPGGLRSVPYGRRGVSSPTEATIGGPWPYRRCACGGWFDPKTREHAESRSLLDVLNKEGIDLSTPCDAVSLDTSTKIDSCNYQKKGKP